jgi:hypothetical protein
MPTESTHADTGILCPKCGAIVPDKLISRRWHQLIGRVRSAKKTAAARRNGRMPVRPGSRPRGRPAPEPD